jgi:hypothetical protein
MLRINHETDRAKEANGDRSAVREPTMMFAASIGTENCSKEK